MDTPHLISPSLSLSFSPHRSRKWRADCLALCTFFFLCYVCVLRFCVAYFGFLCKFLVFSLVSFSLSLSVSLSETAPDQSDGALPSWRSSLSRSFEEFTATPPSPVVTVLWSCATTSTDPRGGGASQRGFKTLKLAWAGPAGLPTNTMCGGCLFDYTSQHALVNRSWHKKKLQIRLQTWSPSALAWQKDCSKIRLRDL